MKTKYLAITLEELNRDLTIAERRIIAEEIQLYKQIVAEYKHAVQNAQSS